MGVAMTKPHPLPHLLNTDPVPWKNMPNFCLVGPLITKQLPVGVAMARLHPMWLIRLTQVLVDHTPNFGMIGHLIDFWQTKQLNVGMAMTKPHPLPPAHWSITFAKFLGVYMLNFCMIGP